MNKGRFDQPFADGAAFCFQGGSRQTSRDAVRKVRLKTVEIIVEEKDWKPGSLQYHDEDIVPVISIIF
ncbi:MAG TPA: hypothetical protein VHN12_15120 [Geobacteraceae bacterium]|nr:hypothetical protein [Geobacteraceae bacterium]